MKLLVQQKIQAVFTVALAFLLLTGATAWWTEQRNAETFRLVEHTYQVLDQFETMLVGILNMETGYRGFAISGDKAFLQSQPAGIAAIQESLAAAKRMTQDNPGQQRRLAALEPLIQETISRANMVVKLRRRGDTSGAFQFITTGQGKAVMDEIRGLIAEMENAEEQLLRQRTARAQAMARTTQAIVAFGGLLSLGLVGLASVIVRRGFEKRQRVEEELEKSRQETARERERLKFIFDAMPIGVSFAQVEADGRVVRSINDAHLRLCGLTREQMDEKGIFMQITHPEDRSFQAAFTRQIKEGRIDHYSMDKRYLRLDGQTVWVFFSFQRRRLANGGHEDLSVAMDITERKQLEEARYRSEQNLAVTLDSIGDAVLATDTEGRVTRLNPVAEKLTGWTQAEALGRPVREVFRIINEDTREPAVIPVENVLATGEIHGLANHTVLIARDGTERPVADSAAPIRDRDGHILGVVLVFRDVAAEHAAQRALRDSEARYRTLFNSLDEGFCVIEMIFDEQEKPVDYRFLEINPSFEKQTGLRDALGRRMREMVPQHEAYWFETYGRVAVTGEAVRFQNRAEQLHRWYDVYSFRFGEPANRQVAILFNDITEHKQAEEQIRVFNLRLEELVAQRTTAMRQALATLDATEEGTLIFDPDTLRFSYANAGAIRQLGYTREELLTMTPVDIKPDFDEVKFRKLLAPMLRGEVRSHRFTALHRHKDGHDIPMEIYLQYITSAGERPRFINIVHDITERQQHERLARRSQRLESIGTLAGGVAHDLNNALAPILISVELLKVDYPKESEIIETIETSAKRGADMVRQLLTFAKGAEGDRVLIQPAHLVKELEKMIKGTFPKNIQLVVKYDPKLPTVLGDATQLHQVLLNLCVNARDAMPHGGTLTLEAHSMEVDDNHASSVPDAKPGKYLALRVRDTGTGIPPEILERIFDPFFTTKGPDKGTGLGLSTVMGIMKGHGGFLQVHSQPGQGSTFTAYLPVGDTGNDTAIVTKAEVEFRGQEETILFVDDEPALREVGRAVLRRLNFKPLTATDGADGLMQAAQHRTELRAIITDLHMPHMDGLAFVRSLRRMLPDIPILVTSGRMEEAVAEEFKALGMTTRLDKPFTGAQLAESLKTMFKK